MDSSFLRLGIWGPEGGMSCFGFPGGTSGKESACQIRDIRDVSLIPRSGRFPGVGNDNPTRVFLPGESYGQRSLVGYRPCDCKESDMTERLTLSLLKELWSSFGEEPIKTQITFSQVWWLVKWWACKLKIFTYKYRTSLTSNLQPLRDIKGEKSSLTLQTWGKLRWTQVRWKGQKLETQGKDRAGYASFHPDSWLIIEIQFIHLFL